MTIRNLEYATRPRSLAIIGASARPGSLGEIITRNIVSAGFEGPVWPVNPRHEAVCGLPCHRDVAALPHAPDLAIIATPAATVPGIVADLGAKGCRAAVVISAGLTRENGLRQAMLDAARPHLFRIIGPNTLGLMIPSRRLNAGFSHMAPRPGNIALLSQSGAIATSIIDWAAENEAGFSHIVSLGDMADVDVGDWLDMLAGDSQTRTIILYLESIPDPRKFMSAARAASRIKPVIAIKAGRHEAAARAAATHTGALAGADRVVEAALRRAGILRVHSLGELFAAAEITGRFRPISAARLGIVTNGGGAGVLAVDRLMDRSGQLAELAQETLARLDAVLPATWSGANPVDIVGDATPERYRQAIAIVAEDPGVDALMVLNCPTGLASAIDAARAVAGQSKNGLIGGKPLLTCWLGEHTANAGRAILRQAGVPSFDTPDKIAVAASHLSDWSRAQKALGQVPSRRSEDVEVDPDAALAVFKGVAAAGRRMLTEPEAKAVAAAYGIPVPAIEVARTPAEVEASARRLLADHGEIVVKLLSHDITHKSDVGGVLLGISTPQSARNAAAAIAERVSSRFPEASIEGYAVQPMIRRRHAQELILGVSRDPIFGPVILFGAGGVAVEVLNDTAIALPPLDDVLVGGLIARTRIGRLLAGYRDRPAVDRAALSRALNGLSQLVVDFPCIEGVDINPLLADATGVIALDARIEIDPSRVEEQGPNKALVIRPYPAEWTAIVGAGERKYLVRPIKPADIELYPPFLAKVSMADMRLRLLAPRRNFPDDMLKRLTQLDYDRDIAFLALDTISGEIAGVGRLSSDPDREVVEYGLLVRTDLQGAGIGWALLHHMIGYARSEGFARIEGVVLAENEKMLAMCRDFGFRLSHDPEDRGIVRVRCDLANTLAY